MDGTAGCALVVIDLQRGVVEGCLDATRVVANTASVVAAARRDGVPVVWVQHQAPWLRPGTDGWRLADPLAPADGEPVVPKRYRDAFADTGLRDLLDGVGARRLVVCGAQSDYCIRTTAQRAAADGYDVLLVGDAHTTTDAEAGGRTVSAADIVAHTNHYFAGLRYPGQRFAVRPAASVDWSW